MLCKDTTTRGLCSPPFSRKSQRIWTEKSTFSVWESLARGGVSYGVFTALDKLNALLSTTFAITLTD